MFPKNKSSLVFTAAIISHAHHFGCELCHHFYQLLLRSHHLVNVLVGSGRFVQTTTDQGYTMIFQQSS